MITIFEGANRYDTHFRPPIGEGSYRLPIDLETIVQQDVICRRLVVSVENYVRVRTYQHSLLVWCAALRLLLKYRSTATCSSADRPTHLIYRQLL